MARGDAAVAGGEHAIATGNNATANNYYAKATGWFATASGGYAIASGFASTASADYAIAAGYAAIASSGFAFAPGYFSAYGMLFSDLRYDYVRSVFRKLNEVSFDEIEAAYTTMEDEGRAALARSGIKPDGVKAAPIMPKLCARRSGGVTSAI